MRKGLYILLLLLSFMIVACGKNTDVSSSAADKTVVLDMLTYGNNTSAEGAALTFIIDNFKKQYPHIEIREERLYDEAYHQKLQARIQSGNVPHIAYLWQSSRSQAVFLGNQAVDLRKYINLEPFKPSIVEPTTPIKGMQPGLYTLPIGEGINSVLYVNMELLESLDLIMPTTYEEIVAMVPIIKEAGLLPVSMANSEAWVMNSTLFGTIVARFTGDPNWFQKAVYDKDRMFTDVEFVSALQFIEQMYADEVLSRDSVRVNYGAALGEFMNKQAVFMIDGHWRLSAIAEDTEFLSSVTMIPFPIVPGEDPQVATASAGEATPGYALLQSALQDEKVLEAAITFLEFQSNTESQKLWAQYGAFIPSYKDIDITDIATPELVMKQDFYNSVKLLANTPDQVLPGKVNEVLNNGLQEIGLGAKTPMEVAMAMQKAFEKE